MTGTPPAAKLSCDEEYSLPCAEALIAGTLALMTGFAQAEEPQREALRGKIAAHLQSLAGLAVLTPHFRTMLSNLCDRWAQSQGEGAPLSMDRPSERERRLWHAAPETLQ